MYVGFATHTGQRRQNQDNGLIDSETGLYVVADGVGGGDSGEVASASVCLTVQRSVKQGLNLEQAIHAAHRVLLDEPISGNAGYAASTIVAIQESPHFLNLAWVGDSRIYLWRGDSLYQLSEDHSVVQQIAGLSELDAQRMRHVLTQAVGVAGEDGLYVENFDVERHAGDCWLLCTDGLHGVLPEQTIKEVLSSREATQDKAQRLVDLALENGADDNVTLVVLDEREDYRAPASPPDRPTVTPEERHKDSQTPALAKSATEAKKPKPETKQPWHYFVLGGVLAVLMVIALVWGL